jgi:hypothetical protein
MIGCTRAAQLIGGPTVLLEYAGLRWLTAPALSPPGRYGWLEKTAGPALDPRRLTSSCSHTINTPTIWTPQDAASSPAPGGC